MQTEPNLPEYEIVSLISSTDQNIYYRAKQRSTALPRLLQIANPLSNHSRFAEDFESAAKRLSNLDHPNILKLHEYGIAPENGGSEATPRGFLVFDFPEGAALLSLVEQAGGLEFGRCAPLIYQSALALHFSHTRGVYHGYLTPSEIWIVNDDERETVKISGFGLPGMIDVSNATLDSFLALAGNSKASGDPVRYDIYCLAICFYFALSGKTPQQMANPRAIADAVTRTLLDSIPLTNVPVGMMSFFARSFSTDPENSYVSMEEFAEELSNLMNQSLTLSTLYTFEPPPSGLLPVGGVFARRYEIEELLGEGGMGQVYRATDRMLGLKVALKIMNSQVVENEKLQRFKREVVLARKVAHSNVCRIYDMGNHEGIHYVSMELIRGKTLSQVMAERKQLSLEEGLTILRQVLDALKEAHRAGIVHRDLKPQNIMIDSSGRTFIMDFGISISIESQDRMTKTGMLVGTPVYMSPEQLQERKIDHRVDIYALGIIMFEIFTGQLPYEANSPVGIILAHLQEKPKNPSEIVPSINKDLERVILKSLEKNPNNRHQSCEELLKDLESTTIVKHSTFSTVLSSKKSIASVMAAVVMAIVIFLLFRSNPTPVSITTPDVTKTKEPSQALMVPVTITALPWATVKMVPLSTNATNPQFPSPMVTPLIVSIPEGEYRIELGDGDQRPAMVETIQVNSKKANVFSYTMPGHDVEKLVLQMHGLFQLEPGQ